MRTQKTFKLTNTQIEKCRDSDLYRLNDSSSDLLFSFSKVNRYKGTFTFLKKIRGKRHWVKLGEYPALSVSDAKKLSEDYYFKLTMKQSSGAEVNPSESERINTVGQLLRWFLKTKLEQRNLSSSAKNNIKSIVEKTLLPRLCNLKLDYLNKQEFATRVVYPLLTRNKVGTVQKVIQVFNHASSLAFSSGLITTPVLLGMRLVDFTTDKVKPKGSKLTLSVLPKLFKDIQVAPFEVQQVMLTMLLFGTRIGETVKMRWDCVDLYHQVWRIPAEDTKTNKEHLCPLTEVAQEVISTYGLHRHLYKRKSQYLFPVNRRWDKHLNINSVGKRISQLAAGEYTSHDIRKLVRSSLTEIGVDYHIGEMILNHSMSNLDKAYIHTHAHEQILHALELWHKTLLDHGLEEILRKRRKNVTRRLESLESNENHGVMLDPSFSE